MARTPTYDAVPGILRTPAQALEPAAHHGKECAVGEQFPGFFGVRIREHDVVERDRDPALRPCPVVRAGFLDEL